MTRSLKNTLALLTLLTLSVSCFAKDADIYSHKKKGAIKGADPVAYFSLKEGDDAIIGSKEITAQWNGATWHFATEENKNTFVANPEKYAPQYGGYCAFAVSHNFTKPTNPNAWKIVDGKLYLNLSKGVQKKWKKDIPGNIQRANANWPNVLN